MQFPRFFCALLFGSVLTARFGAAQNIGIFEDQSEIGPPRRTGSASYQSDKNEYTVSGGGSNMWFAADAFHYVWKKVSGDVALAADIQFLGTGGDPHRKACLVIRQSLDPDSPYADAALHGDGLTSLQYRESKAARTYEIQANAPGPRRLRIEKRGKYLSMSMAKAGEELHPAGGTFRLLLADPFYIGLAVCAHNDAALETAVFANVALTTGPAAVAVKPQVFSTLETITLSSKDRRAIFGTTNLIEAPNWSRDGFLYYNSKGRIFKIAATGGPSEVIDTGFANRCNNDHGISPDGHLFAISDQSQERRSIIYTVPIAGGAPQRITPQGPSYWHGWSPDGKTLAFCGERKGEFDIYTIPVNGGEEKRLTTASGLDDGPDYSSDGNYIYFNSERSGSMQIWRMRSDGSEQSQITSDEFNNWFAHPSPDGKWLVFLSYEKDVKGHPENKDVTLRLMPLAGGKIEVLAKLFGGQGTINVPSWSPDSKKLAFVSYQFLP